MVPDRSSYKTAVSIYCILMHSVCYVTEFIDETITETVGRIETFLQFVTVRETV